MEELKKLLEDKTKMVTKDNLNGIISLVFVAISFYYWHNIVGNKRNEHSNRNRGEYTE